ncbi:MAG: MotA/TolQ/ExbB proton channel family protein [Verrucomicrobiales bacterium]|nr:MotA/TolQ/ExbB proton channel family protein [Verrucomicrobiales bacterium]
MWLLGAFSFALVGLAVYCFLDFNPKNFYPTEEEEFLREKISRADLGAVIEKSNEKDAPTMAKMCAAIATHVNEYGYSADEAELHRDLIAEAGQKSNRHRARFVNYFAVIAQAAPMAGLLGTVSGMIKAFGKLGQGLDNPNVLASHISEALITTATGLVIALPAIFLYFHLRDKLESLVSESEDRANRMLGLLRQAALASTVYEEESLASRENAYRNGAADTE